MRPLAALAATLVLAVLLPVPPAEAGGIQLRRIQYDSPGTDTRTNASLNAEWVRIANTGARGRSLKGWTVRDAAGKTYTFGTFTLAAGEAVTLHTGSGDDTARHRYWRSGNYIWNNTSDVATLKNAAGTVVDRCSYPTSADSPYPC